MYSSTVMININLKSLIICISEGNEAVKFLFVVIFCAAKVSTRIAKEIVLIPHWLAKKDISDLPNS